MKLNWGINIALFYIVFVIVLLMAVFLFMNQDVGLVTNDYYAKEIAYQEEINKINRAKELTEQLDIVVEPAQIKFSFPRMFKSSDIGGTIHFYRPSDKEKDFVTNIVTDTSRVQIVQTGELIQGLWKIKINWNVKNNSYFNEKIVMVN